MGLLDEHKVDRVRQLGELCPRCNKGILISKKGKYGAFLSCNTYPTCHHSESKGVNLQALATDLLKVKKKKRRRAKKTSKAKKAKACLQKQRHLAMKKARRELAEHWQRANFLMDTD